MGALLYDGDNKIELINFLINCWRTNSSVQVSIPLYLGYEDKCIYINVTSSHFVTEFESNQKEADTQMLLHAKHASQTINNVIIHTPDTDVLLITLAASTELRRFTRTGIKVKSRLISMNKIKSSLGSLYDLDDINSEGNCGITCICWLWYGEFSLWKRENKASEKNRKYKMMFSSIGPTTDLKEKQLDVLQEFVCDIYSHKGTSTNNLRFKLYCSKQGKLNDWRWDCLKWNTVKLAPEEVLENSLFCADVCTKTDRENYINKEVNNQQNEEEEVEGNKNIPKMNLSFSWLLFTLWKQRTSSYALFDYIKIYANFGNSYPLKP